MATDKKKRLRGRKPRSNHRFTFTDLFAGIGGIRLGLERADGQRVRCVFSSEWDEEAATVYETFFGDRPFGDIREIEAVDIPDHDILTAGFPCQAFSIIGDKRGFADTRGTLFFEIERILAAKRPRAFLLENVKNLVGHDSGRTFGTILDHLQRLEYHVYSAILNALDFGLPQKRERVIIVGFKENHPFQWPNPATSTPDLSSVLEPDETVPAKYFASASFRKSVERRLIGKTTPPKPWICHENKSGNISPLPFACALRAGASYNYLLVNGVRRLTPRENLRLQGFPENYPIAVSDAAVRKQCGNSVPVPMIEAVARQMIKALREKPLTLNGAPVRVAEGQLEIAFA